jgi:hypothetical protein
MLFTARCTARRMRCCVPQRHRWPAKAALICASVGCAITFNKATVPMI